MKVIITSDYEEMSERASEIVVDTVRSNPKAVLGLATGSTPLGLYARLVADRQKNGTSYKFVSAYNLDEYIGVSADNVNSYAYFMRVNLFDKIDIDLKSTHIENGVAVDENAECARYNKLLDGAPRDLQLLGLGSNGHIAFNEPGTPFDSVTHVVELTESTINDNSRLFESKSDVPTRAFTMGLKNITDAKKILILAAGANKAQAVYSMLKGEVTTDVPASVLQLHADCTLIVDKAAARLI